MKLTVHRTSLFWLNRASRKISHQVINAVQVALLLYSRCLAPCDIFALCLKNEQMEAGIESQRDKEAAIELLRSKRYLTCLPSYLTTVPILSLLGQFHVNYTYEILEIDSSNCL